jgi:RNA polymerase sigma factor (TIGR02999 family)
LQPEQGEITVLLHRWKEGDRDAFERLMQLVYPRLRELAGAYLRRERWPGVMQPTSLVHEFYLRLVTQKKAEWEDRRHFFAFSAQIMRMILIDNARANQAQRRGGGVEHVPLDEEIPWVGVDSPEIVELGEALDELATVDADKVRLVELRYFLGCTAEETAAVLNVSKSTVDRDLRFARGWLYRHMKGEAGQAPA